MPTATTSPPAASPDINIPPPNSSAPPTAPSTPDTSQAPAMPIGLDLQPLSLSPTQIVIALVLVLVWAGLLIFVRRVLTQSLVSQFADLGRSRAAGTMLYLFLLVLGATVIFCALGSFWSVLKVVAPAAAVNVVLFILFLFSLIAARSSRQRR